MNYKFYDLILRPVVTEKSTLASELKKYVFFVQLDADKYNIKKAVESIFNVNVVKVNIINVMGKVKRFKGVLGKQVNRKKAVVTIAKEHVIDFGIGGIK
ncbi:50S ribosomal protein L23 [Orientia chuto str. Dubai]|uniref:Large ribosomal subunit protein uL23 n=1 Tax=Orientia chuto str. Dubai TaxID=1359168 RepID=A0A0F3MHN1_9RICK|nr:50S ribosomal protein L23 [Candidatus Orientia mediorientalis]KJV55273.1 50S ribosomal protein L23 [Orientia chuto str. Dubai]